jgi:putative hemolysin
MTLFLLGFCFVFLLLLLALVSALETAMYSLREWDGDELGGGEGGHLQKRLRKIRLNPFAQLRQTLLLSAGLNLALALLGFYLVQGPLRELGLPPWWSGGILFVVAVVLGDALPKLHVVGRAEGLVVMGSRLLVPVRLVLDPLAGWADRCADGLLRRLLGVRRRGRVPMTRDEFETLVELRAAQGALSGDEAAMIREVLDLEALIVGMRLCRVWMCPW